MSDDRIEKITIIRASPDRVWRALTDSEQFGRWFGARFEGPFVAGRAVRGIITPSELASPEETANHPYLGRPMVFHVERIEPPHRFSYRWHPLEGSAEPGAEAGPSTLVEFTLEPIKDGTRLTVVESGFSALPEAHRKPAFQSHEGGWGIQVQRVRVHIEQA